MSLRHHHRTLQSLAHSTLASLAAFVVFALAVLSVSPAAHAWIHASDDRDHPESHPATAGTEHFCAVTLAQQGFCDTAPPLPRATAPADVVVRRSSILHVVRWTAPEHWLQPAQGPPVG